MFEFMHFQSGENTRYFFSNMAISFSNKATLILYYMYSQQTSKSPKKHRIAISRKNSCYGQFNTYCPPQIEDTIYMEKYLQQLYNKEEGIIY